MPVQSYGRSKPRQKKIQIYNGSFEYKKDEWRATRAQHQFPFFIHLLTSNELDFTYLTCITSSQISRLPHSPQHGFFPNCRYYCNSDSTRRTHIQGSGRRGCCWPRAEERI